MKIKTEFQFICIVASGQETALCTFAPRGIIIETVKRTRLLFEKEKKIKEKKNLKV